MKQLPDVNLLVALLDKSHPLHPRASRWYSELGSSDTLLSTPITDLGFIRVIMLRTKPNPVPVTVAKSLLRSFKQSSRVPVVFQIDDLPGDVLPSYVKTHSQTTDGHLLALAQSHGAKFVTLDTGIPGAELIQ